MGAQTLISRPSYAVTLAAQQAAPSPVVFQYEIQAQADVNLPMIDTLADALGELPRTTQIRVVMEIGVAGRLHCWMMMRGLSPQAEAELLSTFEQLGIPLRSGTLPEFDFDDATHAVVKVREGGSVTRPGMTRELTRWLIQRGHVAYLVFDSRHTSVPGLAYYDLAFVMRDQALPPFADVVAEVMDTATAIYRRRQAAGFFKSLRAWTLPRPKLDACMGNIADLFPL